MGRVISFGGVLLREGSLDELAHQVDLVAEEWKIPAGTEIKWSPPKDNWIYSNLKGDRRSECYKQILRSAAKCGADALVVCWAEGRSSLKGDDAFNEILDYAFERVSIRLEGVEEYGLFVVDWPGGGRKEDIEFLQAFLQRVRFGTDFVPPDRIKLNVLTTPSRMLRQLQVADLVVGVTTAMVAGLLEYAPPVFEEIRPMLVTNSHGLIGGTGLKISPDRLENLYFWVLGESEYAIPGQPRLLPIPDQHRPYATDGFEP